jgi:hypothetical protein
MLSVNRIPVNRPFSRFVTRILRIANTPIGWREPGPAWELTVLDVQMRGKAHFFKTIGAHQQYSRSEFKSVRDDMPIAQALESLKQAVPSKQDNQSATGGDASHRK